MHVVCHVTLDRCVACCRVGQPSLVQQLPTQSNCTDAIEMLVSGGADVNAKDVKVRQC